MRRFTLLAPAAGLVIAQAPAPAFAVDYLTPEQAQRAIFPEADAFEARTVALTPEERAALAARLGPPSPALRPAVDARPEVLLRVARRGGARLGVVVIDEVIGKFERITYAAGIAEGGEVRDVEILSYRESHGQEVRLPAWRRQFVGKTAAAPLRVGEDVAGISGATLSCAHVTEGVRRLLATVDLLRREGRLP